MVQDGIDEGQFEPIDVTAASFAISGVAMGTFHWFRHGGRLDADEVANLLAELAIRMMRPS